LLLFWVIVGSGDLKKQRLVFGCGGG